MDDIAFDRYTWILGMTPSRRTALGLVAGTALGGRCCPAGTIYKDNCDACCEDLFRVCGSQRCVPRPRAASHSACHALRQRTASSRYEGSESDRGSGDVMEPVDQLRPRIQAAESAFSI